MNTPHAAKQYLIGEILKIDLLYEYKVIDIKEGGMAIVLVCERQTEAPFFDLIHRKQIAIKTFKSGPLPINSALFEHELKVWINLENQNIVPLLKVLYEKGRLIAIMPFYRETLRTILNSKGVFAQNQSARILLEIIRGLDYAYRKHGVVHQDIKPENILVERSASSNELKYLVSDWGISNLQSHYYPAEPESGNGTCSIYETLSRMGTLPYMGPERLSGAATSLESDIYALGVMFFEMLVGFLPFNPRSGGGIPGQILEGACFQTAQAFLPRSIAEIVRKVILRCLNPDPRERYRDYHSLSKDLDKIARKKLA